MVQSLTCVDNFAFNPSVCKLLHGHSETRPLRLPQRKVLQSTHGPAAGAMLHPVLVPIYSNGEYGNRFKELAPYWTQRLNSVFKKGSSLPSTTVKRLADGQPFRKPFEKQFCIVAHTTLCVLPCHMPYYFPPCSREGLNCEASKKHNSTRTGGRLIHQTNIFVGPLVFKAGRR